MQCAKCGTDIPQGEKQCPNCGLVNEFRPAPPGRSRKPVLYVIIGLLAVIVIALLVALVAGRGRENVVGVPPAAPPPPQSVVQAPPATPAPANPVNPPSAAPKPKPPQAVVDYLNYVKGVEEHRQKLLKDTTHALTLAASSGQASSLLNLIDMAMDPEGAEARDPLADTKNELVRQYKNWLNTLAYFDKQPAPPECREFSGQYRAVLFSETKAIGNIAVSFNLVNVMDPKDMSKLLSSLQKLKGDPTIQDGIDKATDDADAGLTKLVSNYDMQKPFSVPREERSGGSIMGF